VGSELRGEIAADLHDMGFAAPLICIDYPAVIYVVRAFIDDIHVIPLGLGISNEVRANVNMRILLLAGNEDIFPLLDYVVFKEIVASSPGANLIDSAHLELDLHACR
jgi:hypothetical protein